ncbi:MAG: mobile mystery protein A [Gemmatimonadales bacterium]
MSRPKKWSKFAALEQKQMDATLRQAASIAPVETPSGGWIKSIRQALGMTAAQLGKRLRTTPQSVLALEKREVAGTITLATLEKAAHALDCRVRVLFIPNHGIEEAVYQRAMDRARDERNRIVHTMGLEGQGTGVREALDLEKIAESWRTKRRTRLWDENES